MAKKGRFVYEGRSSKEIKERASQSGGNFDSYTDPRIPRYKVKEGDNNVRILPPGWLGDKESKKKWGKNWGIEIHVHNGIGPDEAAYLCPMKMNGDDCPLCDARQELQRDDEEAADKLKPQKRVLAYVIDRDKEKEGPMLWAMPWTVERDIQIRSQNKKTGEGIMIDDPNDGYDVSFTREGTGLRTRYVGVDVSREASPIHDKESTQDKWLEFITENSLPDTLKFFDAEYLEQVYMGKKKKKKGKDKDDDDDDRDEDEDEDEDEDDTRGRNRKRRAKEDEDEDEDEDDDDKSKKKSKRSRDEDEDEDEDDDEPKGRSRSGKNRRSGKSEDDEEDEDEDDRRSRSRKSRRDRDEDESDEDSDDEDEDEDEDDKSKKARSSLKKLKNKKRKDEDEDDDD